MKNDVSMETTDEEFYVIEVPNHSGLYGAVVGATVGVGFYIAVRGLNKLVDKIRYRKYYR